jgi:PAN domain
MLGRSTQCFRVMQHLQAAFVTFVVVLITLMLAAPAMAGYSNFVFAPQADSPGNDYKRLGDLSFDECVNRCDADTACNAFTYNRLKQICFLKSAAAQWTIINLGAITGIRLSPFSLEGETKKDQSSVQDEKKQ